MNGLIHILLNTLLVLYIVTGIFWIVAFFKGRTVRSKNIADGFRVSVVIAARNEEHNIPFLLRSLLEQDHEYGMEVIVSDDHSEDGTIAASRNYMPEFSQRGWGLKVITSSEGDHAGKKHALRRAIEQASGEIILTTDADCTVQPQWIRLMTQPFSDETVMLVAGYVVLEGGRSFIERFQSIEQSVLSFISCAAIRSGLPFMSNGANLAFRSKVYDEVGGYGYGEEHPGGDDTFLMLSVNRIHPGSIRFVDKKGSAVSSIPMVDTLRYLQQRKRHGSKVNMYNEAYIKLVGLIITCTNILHFISYLGILLFPSIAGPACIFLAVKLPLDLAVGFLSVKRFSSSRSYAFVIPFTLVYPIYLIIVSLQMIFSPGFEWKGRHYPHR